MFYKQRLVKPYKEVKGVKHTTCNLRNVGGIYIIYDLYQNVKYIGMSGNNLYRTMYRHFQDWKSSNQIRVTYNPNRVKVAVTYSTDINKIYDLEKALIIKYRDKFKLDNPNQYREKKKDEPYVRSALEEYYDVPTNPVINVAPDENFEYPF